MEWTTASVSVLRSDADVYQQSLEATNEAIINGWQNDGCTGWFDSWLGVSILEPCQVHDGLYGILRIHPKFYKIGRKRGDKILAYGVARRLRAKGKSTRMAWAMYRGLRIIGGFAWRSNGKKLRKKFPDEWAKYHPE